MRAIVSFLCILFAGCFTVSQLQSPKVLEMGKLEFNGGLAIARFEDFGPNELFGGMRVGVGSNTDIGFRIYGWLPRKGKEGGLAGVYVDAKYQFTEKPPYVSGVLGLSYLTLQPALIVGTDRFYASVGAVLILIPSLNSRDEFSGVAGLAKLAVGYSFGGKKFKLTPEIGAIFPITEGEFPGSPYYTAFGISIRP
jgi:hypothetical protein